eukprot:XP_011676928.1 PREDICTED: sperm receptor for egg jelly-like [Strongylocentrotus purpuratus]
MNGGTCADGFNNFTCFCEEGFTGSMCETEYGCFRPWFYGPAFGYCYLWERVDYNWTQARESCIDQGRGAELASIHSAEENAFVYAQIRRYAWIGLSDQVTEGVFDYADGTPVDYLSFPDKNKQSETRDCVYVKHLRVDNWSLLDCRANKTSICKSTTTFSASKCK